MLIEGMDDALLRIHTQQLIHFFGGMQQMLVLCLKDRSNLNLIQNQELFKLLHSFKQSEREESPDIIIMSQENESPSSCPAAPVPFLGLHDICISHIFRFLDQRSHFRLQAVSRLLTIIGRKRDSFLTDPANHTQYLHFGNHLSLVHNLSYILEQTASDDIQHVNHWRKGIDRLNVVGLNRMEDVSVVIGAGIPLMLMDKLRHCIHHNTDAVHINDHSDLCLRILNIINNLLSYKQCQEHLITNGLLTILMHGILGNLSNGLDCIIEVAMESLQKLVVHRPSTVGVITGELHGFPSLVRNLTKCTFSIESALSVMEHILKSPYFDWNSTSNIPALRDLSTSVIFQCLDIQQQSVGDEWVNTNNSVIHILSAVHHRFYFELQCDDRNLNLILFSLQRTNLGILGSFLF